MDDVIHKRKTAPNEIDNFMVQKTVAALLEELEKNGWLQEEVAIFPRYMESAIQKNSERLMKTKPFTMYKAMQNIP